MALDSCHGRNISPQRQFLPAQVPESIGPSGSSESLSLCLLLWAIGPLLKQADPRWQESQAGLN